MEDTSFWDVIVWMVVFFAWMLFFWMFIAVFADVFRRRDISGWVKALWIVAFIFLPFIGILVYMVTRPADATREQDLEIMAHQQRLTGVTSTDEIANAQKLLQSGAITQAEFDQIKARALA